MKNSTPFWSRRRFLGAASIPLGCALLTPRVCSAGTSQLPAAPRPLLDGNTAFSFAFQSSLGESRTNQFFSPLSLVSALSLAALGARGETQQEMLQALQLRLQPEELPALFGQLQQVLTPMRTAEDEVRMQFVMSNRLWGQAGFPYQADYLKLAREGFRAPLETVDFIHQTEAARKTINDSVAKDTQQKIQDLIPMGALDRMTRLVLTNAIYFKAEWQQTFPSENTKPGPFRTEAGTSVSVPMMANTIRGGYTNAGGFELIRLPYQGNQASLTIALPAANLGYSRWVRDWSESSYTKAVAALNFRRELNLKMPKFKVDVSYQLGQKLAKLGMKRAFSSAADFSGITTAEPLLISEVIHKAYCDVTEAGTEAAAATGIVMRATSMPLDGPIPVTIDRPFWFCIEHQPSGAILFAGHVAKP